MRILIIGSGLAGQVVLREIREYDQDSEIVMLSDSSADFYLKPGLSRIKAQAMSPDDLVSMTKASVMETYAVDIHEGVLVQSIDRDKKVVHTTHDVFQYDRLILALGAAPIMPPGIVLSDNVFQVNHLDDYRRVYPRIKPEAKVLLVGGGLIGVEFAHDFAKHCQVTLIERSNALMASMLPEVVGKALATSLEKLGVNVCCGESIRNIVDQGHAVEVTLGAKVSSFDVVICATGIRSKIDLAKACGLTVNQGICVDRYGRTSDPDIYALGDCAEVEGLVKHYVAPLRICAKAIAKHLCQKPEAICYQPMPVLLKTPSYPICFCYKTMPKRWEIYEDEDGIEALAYENDVLLGFVLTAQKMKQRMQYKSKMRDWL